MPFPPISVAEAIARLVPGGVAAFFIDRLQHKTLPLTVVATAVALSLLAAGLGALFPRVEPRLPGGPLAAAGLLSAPIYAFTLAAMQPDSVTVSRPTYGLALIPVFGLAAWITARTYTRLHGTPKPKPGAEDPARRTFLLAAGVGAAGLALGWAELGRILFPRPDPGRLALHVADLEKTADLPPPAPGDAAFGGLPFLSPRVTPTPLHYVVDEEIIDPDIDPSQWRLRVFGVVDHPFEITYEELLAMPSVEQYQTLECISNPVGGSLISTAKWTGVPMLEVLGRAGVRPPAVEVVSQAVGGYADSIPIDQAMLPTTLVAVGMNGNVLPRQHGFPARLLVPGLYGMKQPKWLESIEVVDRPFTGFWEQRGWIKAAVAKTMSRIDGAGTAGGAVQLAGVAFAGDRGISRVEVSTDGATWEEAELETEISNLTWRRWRYPLPTTPAGRVIFRVRAIDGSGVVQIAQVAPPHPSGSTGYDAGVLGG